MLRKHNIFSRTFSSIDGSRISHKQRGEQKLKGSEFTYGEINFLHFLPVLNYAADCQDGSSLVFWDLGAGAGKVLIAAALAERFSRVCGVELLGGLCEAGQEACARFEKVAEEEKWQNKTILEVVNGDMLKTDWSDADVIYASSICFPESLMNSILDKAKSLKKGAILASLKMVDNESFKLIQGFKVKMTWGSCDVHIFRKI